MIRLKFLYGLRRKAPYRTLATLLRLAAGWFRMIHVVYRQGLLVGG